MCMWPNFKANICILLELGSAGQNNFEWHFFMRLFWCSSKDNVQAICMKDERFDNGMLLFIVSALILLYINVFLLHSLIIKKKKMF